MSEPTVDANGIFPVESLVGPDGSRPPIDDVSEPGSPLDANPPAPPEPGDSPVTTALTEVMTSLSAISARLANLETRGAAPEAALAPLPAPPTDMNAETAALYGNPAEYVANKARGIARTELDQFSTQLTPFLQTVAETLAERGTSEARTMVDKSIGDGAFDKLVADDLQVALSKLAPAQRANASYVQAIAAGVLGGKMLSNDGQQEIREIMANRPRPASPVVLSGNRARPAPERLTSTEIEAVDRIRRSGVPFSERQYLEARNRPRTEEAWGATWMNTSSRRAPPAKGGA